MYGLSPDINLTFLRGLKLIQVCISSVQVQFHFVEPGGKSPDTSISVEMSYTHQHGNDQYEWGFEAPVSDASSVLSLIGTTVTDFRGDPDGTLMLKFSNGDLLTLFDETPEYQAYRIFHGNDPPIVV